MLTTTCHRFKRDRRGISNIIVIALSLVIILAIVSNIVLWNYEMNQVDWEKMKEETSITNVEAVTHSSWIVAQNEYLVNKGSHTSGSYKDTQSLDSQYETFTEVVSTEGWLADWDKRVKITICSKDIDESLTDFPVLIFLSNSSGENDDDVSFVFDDLQSDANRKKIAVTTSDGITQCYVEIERWNHASERAWLWVKVPSISNTMDTDFYLYYDSEHEDNVAYVGDPNSAQAENVWASQFKLVSHMNDDPDISHIRDSTPNVNDGTKEWPNNPIQADGKIGKAQEFYTIIGDHVNCGTNSSLDIRYTLTIEAWVQPDSLSTVHQNSIVDRGSSYWFFIFTDGTLAFLRFKGGFFGVFSTIATIPTGTFTHVAVTYDNSALDEVKLYINGELSSEGSLDGPIDSSASNVYIGDRANVHPFDGIIDEVRISNEVISADWIKSNYENERDDLLVFGIEERLEERNALEIVGILTINPSTYPLTNIQTVEIQLMYSAGDSGENWYLEAYNWTASIYSDNGFNSTTGHTPTTGWDYYVVNLTDGWQSYVHSNGTINVKFVDQGNDSEQTSVGIDFLGVRTKMDGTQFTFENDGALTIHLVSLWMINSTNHQRYDLNIFINSAATKNYVRYDFALPSGNYTVKVVTDRGNAAVYSETEN